MNEKPGMFHSNEPILMPGYGMICRMCGRLDNHSVHVDLQFKDLVDTAPAQELENGFEAVGDTNPLQFVTGFGG